MTDDQYAVLIEKLGEIRGDFREFKGTMATQVSFHTTQIDEIKEQAKDDRKWARIQTGVVIPVVAGLHQIASYLGLIK